MSHTPHELGEEFPDLVDRMRQLRGCDAHFSNLCESYHEVNRSVHRAETNVEPTADDHLNLMRKERMTLKDQIYAYLISPLGAS